MVDQPLTKILIDLLEYKKKCKKENISEDEMETNLLSILESAGIIFSR